MNNAVQHYGQGALSSNPQAPFLHTDTISASPSSTTSTLRQFRKKDNLEKHSASQDGVTAIANSTENQAHVARVAPHNHFPPRSNDYYRPNNAAVTDYCTLFKDPQQVKYSEISDHQPTHHDHLSPIMQKPNAKEYMGMMSQAHPKQTYPEHHLNSQQNYSPEALHPSQYMHKEPQMHSYKPPESQYFQKEQYVQQMSKYNMPGQIRKYPSQENDFFSQLQKFHPSMARSIMTEHHIRESQMNYTQMDQNRMYNQSQRYYPSTPIQNPGPYHSNSYGIPQHYNYAGPQNCNYNNRQNQIQRFSHTGMPPGMDSRSISPASRRGTYQEMVNYAPIPQKISPSYHHQYTPEYAQHYQHRRNNVPSQDYYAQQCRGTQFIPSNNVPNEIPENRVTPSNDLKQFIENWAEDENPGDISKDQTVFIVNSDELQYIENNVIITSPLENGQFIIKNIENRTDDPDKVTPKEGDCMLNEPQANNTKVVIHSNTLVTPSKDAEVSKEVSTKVDKNCSPINLEQLEDVEEKPRDTVISLNKNIDDSQDESLDSSEGKSESKDMPMIDFLDEKAQKNGTSIISEESPSEPTKDSESNKDTLTNDKHSTEGEDGKKNEEQVEELNKDKNISNNLKTPEEPKAKTETSDDSLKKDLPETLLNTEDKTEKKLPKMSSRRKKRIFSVDDIINNIGKKKEKEAKRRKSMHATQKFLDLERSASDLEAIKKNTTEVATTNQEECPKKEPEDSSTATKNEENQTKAVPEETKTPTDEPLPSPTEEMSISDDIAQVKEISSTDSLNEAALEAGSSNIQYRSAIKIEENSVLLHIAGELVEINVNILNGKKVITVVPISETTLVDFNDNYETLETVQEVNLEEEEECKIEDAIVEQMESVAEKCHLKEELPNTINNEAKDEESLNEVEMDKSLSIEPDVVIEDISKIDTISEEIVEDIAKIETVFEEEILAQEITEIETIENIEIEETKNIPKNVEIPNEEESSNNNKAQETVEEEEVKEVIETPKVETINNIIEEEEETPKTVQESKMVQEKEEIKTTDKKETIALEKPPNEDDKVAKVAEKIQEEEKKTAEESKHPKSKKKIVQDDSDIIDMSNEIIIGDESLELEVELDLQNDGQLEETFEKNVVLCTKAAKKAYDTDFMNSIQKKQLQSSLEPERKKKPVKINGDNSRKKEESSTKRLKKVFVKTEETNSTKKQFEELVKIRNMKKLKNEQKNVDDDEYVSFKELVKARKLKKMKKLQDGKVTSNIVKKDETVTKDEKTEKKEEASEDKLKTLKKFRLPPRKDIKQTQNSETSEDPLKPIEMAVNKEEKATVVEEIVKEKSPDSILKKENSPVKPVRKVSFSDENPEVKTEEKEDESLKNDSSKKKRLTLEDYNNRKRKISPNKEEVKKSEEKMNVKKELKVVEINQRPKSLEDFTANTKEPVALKRKMSLEEFSSCNDWEETLSPKINSDVNNETQLTNNFKGLIESKPRAVIDLKDLNLKSNDRETSSSTLNNNLEEDSKPEESCNNKKDVLQMYKDQVDSKLSSLSLNIPKKSTSQTVKNQICTLEKRINNFSLTPKDVNENQMLMTRFLKKEYLTEDEMIKIKQIIQYKRMVQHLNKLKAMENDDPAYEIRKELDDKDLKLHLKKVPEEYHKKRKRRFRNLYTNNSGEDSDSDFEVSDKDKALCDYSVVQQNCQYTGVPKLIIKRKVDMPQPIVRLERLDMSVYKKRKWY